jgi:hypothetical protein
MDRELLPKLQSIFSSLRLPQAQARLLAHRYSMPWQMVESFAGDLSAQAHDLVIRAVRELDANDSHEVFPDLDGINEMFASCQSPIEELFLASFDDDMFAVSWERTFIFDFPIDGRPAGSANQCAVTEAGPLFMQYPIGKYRTDFAILCRGEGRPGLAIELDGHAFHERTKQQAQRDKSRDRQIQADGWHMLRFTGSEIWKNPTACVTEALNAAHKLRVLP